MRPGALHAVPARSLAVLTALVLGVHLLLLQARPGVLSLSSPLQAAPLVTRVIEPSPIPAPPAPAAPPVAPPVQPATPPAPAAPAPSNAPTAEPATPTPPAEAAAAPAPPAPPEAPPAPPPEPPPVISTFQIPGSVVAHYAVAGEAKGIPYRAKGTLIWSHDGNQYQARLSVSVFPLGTREQVSTGRLTPDGLAPQRFSDRSRSEQAAHFQRDKGVISFSNNAPDVPLQAGAQDQLSVLLQLTAMLSYDPSRYPPGTRIEVQTAGARGADTWTLEVTGSQDLEIGGKAVNALRLERAPRGEHDQKAELWFAPQMDYLPVRVRLTQQGGDFVDLLWDGADRL